MGKEGLFNFYFKITESCQENVPCVKFFLVSSEHFPFSQHSCVVSYDFILFYFFTF